MKDLDFDEIDRAVNSVNSTAPIVTDPNNPVEKTLDLGDGTSVVPKPLVGRPSTGQFMDVVHPSSDMRRSTLTMPSRNPVQTVAVPAPLIPSPVIEPPVVIEQEPIAAPTPTIQPAQPVTESPTPPKDYSWPDPIDVGNKSEQSVPASVEAPVVTTDEDDDIDKISDEITKTLNQKANELSDSPDSPFISGTVVEKRPLGAFSNGEPEPRDSQPAEGDTPDDTDKEKATKSDNTDESLPAELQEDLLKIESDVSVASVEPVAEDEPVAENTTESPVETPEVKDFAPNPVVAPAESTTPAVVSETSVPTSADSQSAGPTSITQQYKEKPSSGDQNTGAIYDTDAYHKPLAHPAKKKPGLSWVIWIVLLLVVSVGAGVAVYYFVIPLL